MVIHLRNDIHLSFSTCYGQIVGKLGSITIAGNSLALIPHPHTTNRVSDGNEFQLHSVSQTLTKEYCLPLKIVFSSFYDIYSFFSFFKNWWVEFSLKSWVYFNNYSKPDENSFKKAYWIWISYLDMPALIFRKQFIKKYCGKLLIGLLCFVFILQHIWKSRNTYIFILPFK